MIKVKFADLNIEINNIYPYIEKMCMDYITNEIQTDFFVSVTEDEISKEGDENFERGYLESLAIYRKIADKILDYDGFLMHGVIISAENHGIGILAKSGVGKTTHTMLWKKMLGDKCRIINGDKPLIRITDGKIYAYGTPYAGKEGININERVELKDICFLERDKYNHVEECDNILERLMTQVYLPKQTTSFMKLLSLLDTFIKQVNYHIAYCNMESDASKIVKEAIFKNDIGE